VYHTYTIILEGVTVLHYYDLLFIYECMSRLR